MTKARSRYVCQACGATHSGWLGRCPECGEWNTLAEVVTEAPSRGAPPSPSASLVNRALPISEIPAVADKRQAVGMAEVGRVLGGGIVPGSVALVSGDPGIGKSTLLLQVAGMLSAAGAATLYISAEESLYQVKMRAERLGLGDPGLYVASETRLEEIIGQIDQVHPVLAVVDSIQAVRSDTLGSSAGSISQVRECAATLVRLAKETGVAVFIIGHVTKTGSIAGPRVLEHMVDTVLYLEGERFHSYRLLRCVKNRFGSTDEVGVFEMGEAGLSEVPNPSEVFLAERLERSTGSAVAITMEGTRPILVEIQALVSPTALAYPRRTANGVDANRLVLLVAVLTKRAGLSLGEQDVFTNVIGGLRVREPAVDLPIALAIASSHYGRPIREDTAVFGEVGLAGELRSVGYTERRLHEAGNLGFGRVLMPHTRSSHIPRSEGIDIVPVRTLAEAIDLALQS